MGWTLIVNIYTDSGLFGVYAETRDAPGRLASSISAEFGKLRNLSAEELAKYVFYLIF